MNRDHRKLKAFELADALVPELYKISRTLPPEEKYGLQSQLRRAAVSVPTNIVEGSARRSFKEYVNFLQIAFGSACEVKYLLELSQKLEMVDATNLIDKYGEVVRVLHGLIGSLSDSEPKA